MRGLILVLVSTLAACNFGNEEIMPLDENGNLTYAMGVNPDAPPQAGQASSPINGWSKTGPLVCGNSSSTVSMQADFSSSNQGCGVYTIQFGINPPASKVFAAIATIVWTIAGNTITRKFAISNGTTISGPGQAVSVTVSDDSAAVAVVTNGVGTVTTLPIGYTPGQSYDVTISVAPGSRPSTEQTPYLTAFPVVYVLGASGGPTAFVTVPVPQNSGAVSLQVLTSPGDMISPVQIEVTESNAAADTLVIYNVGLAPTDHIPLVPGATQVTILNLTAGTPNLQIIWGIDG